MDDNDMSLWQIGLRAALRVLGWILVCVMGIFWFWYISAWVRPLAEKWAAGG